MPITGTGWEMHVIRKSEQRRKTDGKRRTVGSYQVYHDGVAQTGAGMFGTMAETKGPGANKPAENGLRIEQGRYPLYTQGGDDYVTYGYKETESPSAKPKPGILVGRTNKRTGILIHPGKLFLSSIGCLNPCTSLPNETEMIDYAPSRRRVIALIENLKTYTGAGFPGTNGRLIPNAFLVVDGEPVFGG
jgi:hypothetical protein